MTTIKTIISKNSTGRTGLASLTRLSLISLIGFVSLMSSCSKDSDDYPELNSASLEVASYMTPFEETLLDTRAGGNETMTRAWSAPDGYSIYEGDAQPIGLCFTQDGQNPNTNDKIVNLFKSSGKWRANPDLELIANANYYLYGYIPHKTSIKCNITDYDGGNDDTEKNANYSTGAILTLSDVPTAMSNDLCVVVGAKHGYDKEHDGNNDGTDRLRTGNFTYKGSATADGNFVFLLFDHLYSSLKINMRVNGKYDELRTIKLKSLQLRTKTDDGLSKDKTNVSIELEATTDGSSPIKKDSEGKDKITYTPTGGITGDGVEFWPAVPNTVETLTTEFKPFAGYFMPMGVTTLILTSVYDVYDKEGNLVRENCKATNTMKLSELLGGISETARGIRYTVNMTILPTYLYVLSDPDLENPGIDVVITE